MPAHRALAVPVLCLAVGLPGQAPTPTPTPTPSAPPAKDPAPGAAAQQPQPPTTVGAPVLVEARKWEEKASEVPQGVSVVGGRALQDQRLESIRDVGFRTPNLFFNEFSAARLSFPTMRGIGSGQGDPAVVTCIGEVPQLTANTTNLPLLDIERVEFLRGPQSTLFGRNALGGVIRIQEKTAPAHLGADLAATFGNFALQEYRVSAGGPLGTDRLRFRVAGNSLQRDGYTRNDATGNDVDHKDQLYGRATVEWLADDHWDLALRVDGSRARDGGFVLAELDALRARPHHVDQDFEGKADRDTGGIALVATRHGQDVDFTSISSFQQWRVDEAADFDFSAFDLVRRRTREDQDAFYQELRLASAGPDGWPVDRHSSMKWLVGLAGFAADSSRSGANDFRATTPSIPVVGVDTSSGDFADWSAAAFGQATLSLDATWDLGFGLRYDREQRRASLRRTFDLGGFLASDVRTHLDQDQEQWVPQASLGYHVHQDLLVYGRFAKGYKAGGFNLAAPSGGLAFRPETSRTWEVGAKGAYLQQRLQVEAAVFWIDWDDMQLSLFDATAGGYVANAGAARSRGAEAEARADVGNGFVLSTALGCTDAVFQRYTDPYGVDVRDRHLAYAPKTTWRLGAEYEAALGSDGRWFAGADWTGVGTYYLDAQNRRSDRFDLVGLQAGVEHGKLRGLLFVRNLLDREYVQVAFQPDPSNAALFVGEDGAPRTFGAEVVLRF